jgi:hypothetical protein
MGGPQCLFALMNNSNIAFAIYTTKYSDQNYNIIVKINDIEIIEALQNPYTSHHFRVNTWNHIAVTYNGNIVNLFVNGILILPIGRSTVAASPQNINNLVINSNSNINESLYIGMNPYSSFEQGNLGTTALRDAWLRDNCAKFPGYISQVKFSNNCYYTNNFIPSLSLKNNNMSNCLFYLDNNFTDLISQTSAIIFDYTSNGNYPMPSTLSVLPRLINYKHNNLVYSFPGGMLLNNYWNLKDITNLTSNAYAPIDSNITAYNPANYDFSNGMCIAFDYYLIVGGVIGSWIDELYKQPNPNYNDIITEGLVLITSNNTIPNETNNTTEYFLWGIGCKIGDAFQHFVQTNTRSQNFLDKPYYGRTVLNFYTNPIDNSGYVDVIINGESRLVYSTPFNTSFSTLNIWFGTDIIRNNICRKFGGYIGNIKIFNAPMPYEIACQ